MVKLYPIVPLISHLVNFAYVVNLLPYFLEDDFEKLSSRKKKIVTITAKLLLSRSKLSSSF